MIARGIAASMIELERSDVDCPNNFIPKYNPAGRIASVNIVNIRTGIHSFSFPIFEVPMNSPITTRTVGVTEALSMFSDVISIAGSLMCRLPISSPRNTATMSGFVVKVFSIFPRMFFLFFVFA